MNGMEVFLGGFGAAIGLVAYVVLGRLQDRSVVRASLRQVDGYEVDNLRESEMLDSVASRAFAPVLAKLVGVGRRLSPVGYAATVKGKFLSLGRADAEAVDRFLAIRLVTGVLAPLAAGFMWFAGPIQGGLTRIIVTGLTGAVFWLGPEAVLNRKVEARQLAIRKALPDVLDLLVISVEAGLGFDQAVQRVVANVEGPLPDEFSRMLGEMRAGASRADAMRAIDTRVNLPDVKSFVMAILQADTFGVSIGRVLRAQADEMRIKRRQFAQERAMKAPVKMLIPMVFCIFPALFVMVLGPAFINISRSF
jgi:tight adherence protein C